MTWPAEPTDLDAIEWLDALTAAAQEVHEVWSDDAILARDTALPFGLALVAAYWPLNSHLALYSAHWSQLLWWLLGLYCAALGSRPAARQ